MHRRLRRVVRQGVPGEAEVRVATREKLPQEGGGQVEPIVKAFAFPGTPDTWKPALPLRASRLATMWCRRFEEPLRPKVHTLLMLIYNDL